MINEIKQHEKLNSLIVASCSEGGIGAGVADTVPRENYLVLKVDRYYNSLKLKHPPPSIDCLIPVKCTDAGFVIYLVELKNIKSPKGFKVKKIYEKFKTTIENFMSEHFKTIFLDGRFRIKGLRLYFVTNPYRQRTLSHRREGSRMEVLLQRKPIQFREKLYQLEHILPQNQPIIENC